MYYELYADSLFLVNFVMNLYLLILVDRSALRTATRGRLLLGAAVGGGCSLLPFVLPGPALLRSVLAAAAGTLGMLYAAFPVRGFRMFLKLMEKLLLYSFCMGGALLFLIRSLPGIRSFLTGIFGILGVGGALFLFLGRFREEHGEKQSICRAELICGDLCLKVNALMDSGNSLVEPVSGEPVCIVDRSVMERLLDALPVGCRAIPYHSIGVRKGILEGKLLPELILDLGGIRRKFVRVWIAVSPQGIGAAENAEAESVKMIINPGLLGSQ